MKKLIGCAAALCVLSGSAFAADLPNEKGAPAYVPVAPAFSWTGFYGGIYGGYGWDSAHYNFDDSPPNPTISGNGGLVGGDFGYNVQLWGNFVVGGEGDIAWSHLSGNTNLGDSGFYHTDIGWIGSVTAKIGYSFNRVLVFADGGGAFAGINHSNADFSGDLGSQATYDTVNPGWTVGGGLEYAFTDHITVNANYRYYDFGTKGSPTTWVDDGFYWYSHTLHVTAQTATAGINYKF